MATAADVEAVLQREAAGGHRAGYLPAAASRPRSPTGATLTGGVFVHYGKRKGATISGMCPWCRLYDPHTLSQTQRETLRIDFYAHARTTQRDPRPKELVVEDPVQFP